MFLNLLQSKLCFWMCYNPKHGWVWTADVDYSFYLITHVH